jgi:hypothetical protein
MLASVKDHKYGFSVEDLGLTYAHIYSRTDLGLGFSSHVQPHGLGTWFGSRLTYAYIHKVLRLLVEIDGDFSQELVPSARREVGEPKALVLGLM